MYVAIQVPESVLNEAITQFNLYIEKNSLLSNNRISNGVTTIATDTSLRHQKLESFVEDEMVNIMGGTLIGKTPLKTIVLGLVHLKRLDISTENYIKVYKVRRFY